MINLILKKPHLDKDSLNNYHPVSNLPFTFKLIERVMVKQMAKHLEENHLSEKFQSVYRWCHSTETALMSVLNGILMTPDRKQAVFLVLFDLSDAFDTVDHSILSKQLGTRIGLRDQALNWVSSYLSQHYQHISVAREKSISQELKCGVPQGSVLGPVSVSIYTLPLGKIIKNMTGVTICMQMTCSCT